jgi:hypothetical protein
MRALKLIIAAFAMFIWTACSGVRATNNPDYRSYYIRAERIDLVRISDMRSISIYSDSDLRKLKDSLAVDFIGKRENAVWQTGDLDQIAAIRYYAHPNDEDPQFEIVVLSGGQLLFHASATSSYKVQSPSYCADVYAISAKNGLQLGQN